MSLAMRFYYAKLCRLKYGTQLVLSKYLAYLVTEPVQSGLTAKGCGLRRNLVTCAKYLFDTHQMAEALEIGSPHMNLNLFRRKSRGIKVKATGWACLYCIRGYCYGRFISRLCGNRHAADVTRSARQRKREVWWKQNKETVVTIIKENRMAAKRRARQEG